MTKYKYEKFENLTEALIWCAENKPILTSGETLDCSSLFWAVAHVVTYWSRWKKAVPIEEPRLRSFWLWDVKSKFGHWYRSSHFFDEELRSSNGKDFLTLTESTQKRKVESSLLILDENGEVVDE